MHFVSDHEIISKFQLFGQEERISGYEGLSVDITLSKKRLVPFLQISFDQKAPAFANIDNIKEKLEKHYGRIFENVSDYTKIIKEEETFTPIGEKLIDITLANGRKCVLYKADL